MYRIPQHAGIVPVNSRYASYDIVRVISTVMILIYHMNEELRISGCHSPFIVVLLGKNLNIGQVGTSVFFILSGVVQSLTWERYGKKTDYQFRKTLLLYYKRRWLSIFPLFYISYAFGHMVSTLHYSASGISYQLIWTLLGMDGYVRLMNIPCSYIVGEWFLGAVLIMYIFFPILYGSIKKKPIISGLLLGVLFLLSVHTGQGIPDIHILNRLMDFSFGIFFWLYLRKISRGIRILSGLIVTLIILLIRLPFPNIVIVICMGVGMFLLVQGIGESLEKNIRNKSVLTTLSALSYPVLLVHHILLQMSLEGRHNLDLGYKGYLEWSIYVILLILIAAYMVYCASTACLSSITMFINAASAKVKSTSYRKPDI